MLNALSLNVGEFFAESSTNKSWLINKKSLTDGVRECLQEKSAQGWSDKDPIEIQFFVSQSASRPFPFHFDRIAFFVSSGFENLLELTAPKFYKNGARLGKTLNMTSLEDVTFGINERSSADGKVLKGVENSDLEFLLSKLQLLGIQDIAIGFLHSNLNSENEKKAAGFFREKGLRVYCSSDEKPHLNENHRWLNALLKARMKLRQIQVETQLLELKEQYPGLELKCLNSIEKPQSIAQSKLYSSLLNRSFIAEPFEAHLHLGLESFVLSNSEGDFELEVSASNIISSGFFNTPEILQEKSSFDPGPMIMGKSFVPCLIDFLFATGLLTNLENIGLTSLVAERAKPRILEALLALIRNNQERKHIDIQKEHQSIEKIMSYRIWSELLKLAHFKRLKVTGPLAESCLKFLKTYRPNNIEVTL